MALRAARSALRAAHRAPPTARPLRAARDWPSFAASHSSAAGSASSSASRTASGGKPRRTSSA